MSRMFPSALVFAIALVVSPACGAVVERSSSAGAVCHAANGGASGMFRRAATYLAHAGTSEQYVICDLPVETTTGSTGTFFLTVPVFSLNPSGSVTCNAVVGSFDGGQTVVSSVSRTATFQEEPLASKVLSWESVDIASIGVGQSLALSCRMTPGMRLGTIRHRYQLAP